MFNAVSRSRLERLGGSHRPETLRNIDSESGEDQKIELTPFDLAAQTGGVAMEKTSDVAQAIRDCVTQAASFYSFSFNPAAAAHADQYHPIVMQAHAPGLTVRTAAGYFAQP